MSNSNARVLRPELAELVEQGLVTPLTEAQKALWLLQERAPRSVAYNLSVLAEVRGLAEPRQLSGAWQRLMDSHAVLRSCFEMHGGHVVQRTRRDLRSSFTVQESRAFDEAWFTSDVETRADEPFDLTSGPLLRATLFTSGAEPARLLVVAHHIILDFHSLELICRGLLEDVTAHSETSGASFREHVAAELKFLRSPRRAALIASWKNELEGAPTALDLPLQKSRPDRQTFTGVACTKSLDAELAFAVRNTAAALGATPYVFYLSVFASLLWRYSGQSEMLIGTPAGGRLDEKFRDAIGYFANSLTVRVRCSAQASFHDLTQQVRATVARVMDLQELPFPVVVRELGLARDPSRSPLFQAFFVWDETRAGAKVDAERQLVPLCLSQRGSAFDLTLTIFHVAGEASLRLQYNTELFSSTFIGELLGHFEALTRSAVQAPQTALSNLDFLSARSVGFITHRRNDTRRATCGELPVHRLFEARATERPEALAIAAQGVRVSYGELNGRANAIAQLLQRANVHAGDAVAVCMERGAEMIAAILAVWKIGACYVPIDALHPEERVQRILSSSRATAALVQPRTQHRFRWPLAPIVIDANLQLCTDFDSVPQALLAYVMYTSGSTGEPKGVEVLHRGVVNCLEHFRVALNLTERDVWLAITTITFDISVLELFASLVSGGTVHIADAQAVYEPKRLLELVVQSNATVLQATPAGWATLIASDMPRFANLQLLCGGEACPRDLADALLERGRCLWNVYGPTETTIWSSAGRVRAGAQPVSAGTPIANTRLYVLDETEQLVPDQVPGELYIAGDGLAKGYRGEPELSASQFKTIHIPHIGTERVYRTGDRARWNDQQELEILGRSDRQLKVNGHRIEPTEVEVALRRHPDLLDAVVDRSADSRLVAYIVPSAVGVLPSSDELSQFLRGSLAQYMIPSVFVGIEAVPRSLAGKVDRNALPSVDAAIARQLRGEPPSNETERALLEIWMRVLHIEGIGVTDDFFDIGGASIQSIDIATLAQQAGLALTSEQVFELRTVRALASVLDGNELAASSTTNKQSFERWAYTCPSVWSQAPSSWQVAPRAPPFPSKNTRVFALDASLPTRSFRSTSRFARSNAAKPCRLTSSTAST